MKPWVREKLDRIHERFPPRRLEASKARWRAVWSGRKPPDRYPFLFLPLRFDYYNDVFSKEEGLRAYLDEFIARGAIDDDFIPAFFPGCRQGTIPGMLGAPEKVVGGDYTNERILFCNEDIDRLPEPSMRPGTPAHDWLEMERYYLEECEGELPVHVCDMQGPMDAAGQLFGYDNLFLCAYDDEERFRKLTRLCADAFCMLWEAQKSLLGDRFVGTHLYGWDWAPEHNGATLSADSMAMFSGDFFREHYTDLLEYIGGRLGSLAVHSCGNFSAVLRALGEHPRVHAVNASQMTVEELLAGGWPADKMIILQEPVERAETVFRLAWEKNLRLDVAFSGLWPRADAWRNKPPEQWTEEDAQAVRTTAARVAKAAEYPE